MNVCECVIASARHVPQRAAIVFEGRRLTYGELNERSAIASVQLTQMGIRPGDRVALMLPNVPAFPIWYYAALRLGAIVVSVSTRLAPAEVSYVLEDSGAAAVVGVGEALAELDLGDVLGVSVSLEGALGSPAAAASAAAQVIHSGLPAPRSSGKLPGIRVDVLEAWFAPIPNTCWNTSYIRA